MILSVRTVHNYNLVIIIAFIELHTTQESRNLGGGGGGTHALCSGQYSVFRLRKYKRCHIAAAGQWLVPARSQGPAAALYSDECADVSPAHSNTRTQNSKLELTLGLLTR